MARRPARPHHGAFLHAISSGTASARLLDAAGLRRQLQALGDPEIETLMQNAWGRSVPPSATAEQDIARYKKLLTPEFLAGSDKSHGRSIFARTCQACHKLYDQGGVLAPDLTGSNRSDLDYLLGNLVDPSAEMGREYQLVTVRLADGRVLTGNMQKETPQALTLKTLAGTMTVPRRDLAPDTAQKKAVEYSKVSLMPPGQRSGRPSPRCATSVIDGPVKGADRRIERERRHVLRRRFAGRDRQQRVARRERRADRGSRRGSRRTTSCAATCCSRISGSRSK